ncbi:hypothetical protein HAX54_042767 [Datura stramonium]|uniref:Uncharacterized protein n=1 Tax=Datura stramonium TaxID=4076 RepID=A0ABS8W2A1_DATST|nr:hypothetical protein [Datura stramonium]
MFLAGQKGTARNPLLKEGLEVNYLQGRTEKQNVEDRKSVNRSQNILPGYGSIAYKETKSLKEEKRKRNQSAINQLRSKSSIRVNQLSISLGENQIINEIERPKNIKKTRFKDSTEGRSILSERKGMLDISIDDHQDLNHVSI